MDGNSVQWDPSSSLQRFRESVGETLKIDTGGDTHRHKIDGVKPKLVVYPEDLQELGCVMQSAYRENIVVSPWGGGTKTSLGNLPERLDVVADLSGLNGIVAHDVADFTATIRAGTIVADIQKVFAEHGQFVALDPPISNRSTIGGALATGLSGPLKWQYGNPRDSVIGMKLVQSDGRIVKSGGQVVKNVSGYDMSKLHIGGLGTLGVIADVSFKLIPLPNTETTIMVTYHTPKDCFAAALDIFGSSISPLALTTFDAQASSRMRLRDGGGSWFLAVRLGGRPLTIERQIDECRVACEAYRPLVVEILEAEYSSVLWKGLSDFGWDKKTLPNIGARVSVKPTRAIDLIESLHSFHDSEFVQLGFVSHPAHGTVVVGWFADSDLFSEEAARLTVRNLTKSVRQIGGNVVITKCDLGVKRDFDVWGDVGESISVMRKLKEQYDPKRILNPGRFVGGI